MKLHELQTIQPKDLTPKQADKVSLDVADEMRPKDAEPVGSGLYADVFANKNDPGTVTKIVRRTDDIKKDGYFQYVSALAKNDRIANNSFFPRIYDIKVQEGKDGMYVYTVTMERLQKFDSLSTEEMQMIADRLFFNWLPYAKHALARVKEIQRGRMPQEEYDALKPTSRRVISFALMKAMQLVMDPREQVQTYVKDPKLRGALMMLRSLLKKNSNIYDDLHHENVMIRRGPGGPQLVITDPLCG